MKKLLSPLTGNLHRWRLARTLSSQSRPQSQSQTKSVETTREKAAEDDVLAETGAEADLIAAAAAKEYDIEPRVERRKPPIRPLIKEVFASNFAGELLAYPEILNKDELQRLGETLTLLEEKGERAGSEVWGAPCDPLYGGWAANMTERCRLLEQGPVPLANRIRDHWFGMDIIIHSGFTKHFADRGLLPALLSGERRMRTLIREDLTDKPDDRMLQTTIVRSVRDECYITGAKTMEADQDRDVSRDTMFVAASSGKYNFRILSVEGDQKNVEVQGDKVIFDQAVGKMIGDTKISAIERPATIGEILKAPLANFRLGAAATCIGILREAISSTLARVKGKYMNGVPVAESVLFQFRISEAVTILYQAESMVYMTCGLADGYESPDIELEAALTKIFTLNHAPAAIFKLNDYLGSINLSDGFSEEYVQAVKLLHRDEIMDMSIIHAGLLGTQYSMKFMQNYLRKSRNPFHFPTFTLKKRIEELFDFNKEPRRKLRLPEYVHLTLQNAADATEVCILQMKNCVVDLVVRHGQETPLAHRDVSLLTEAGYRTYGMIASLSRASRAYCIGLPEAEKDVYQALIICSEGRDTVKKIFEQIQDGAYAGIDKLIESVAKANIKNKAPLADHPLARVYY